MENSRIAFQLLTKEVILTLAYKEITCHNIFSDKIDMTRKYLYFAGGKKTDPPYYMTYASVVSWDSTCIESLVYAINTFVILSEYIQNSYLYAPMKEKFYFYAGDRWKSDHEKLFCIIWDLYGIKYSDIMWKNHLVDILWNKFGFKSSLVDPGVWYKFATVETGFK